MNLKSAWEAFTERAAILEYDAGLDRKAATLAAFALYFPKDFKAMKDAAAGKPDGETTLYEFLEGLIVSPGIALEGTTVNADTKNVESYGKALENTLQTYYEGLEGIRYMTAHGIPIKDFYKPGSDVDAALYSTETPIEQGKRYKVFIRGRFLCLDIDRKLQDIEKEGARGDGLKNLYAWLESIGKPWKLLPAYLQDIENGSFPCYMKTPSGGLHLYFKYKDMSMSGALCPHVEIKTVQLSAGYKDGKPYIFTGDIDKAPNLPAFIRGKLPKVERQTPRFIPLRQESKQYGKPSWEKIIDWTNADGKGTSGRNEYTFSLAVHAKNHLWTENETLEALRYEPRIDGLPESEIISAVKSAYRRVV